MIHNGKNIYCPVLRGNRSVYCVALTFCGIPERAGRAELEYGLMSGLPCSLESLGIFWYLQSKLEPIIPHLALCRSWIFPREVLWRCRSRWESFSPLTNLTPVTPFRKWAATAEETKLSEPHSGLGKGMMRMPMTRAVSSQWTAYRTAHLAGIVQGWGKLSLGSPRPGNARNTRGQLTVGSVCCYDDDVYGTESTYWIYTYNIGYTQRGNVDRSDVMCPLLVM